MVNEEQLLLDRKTQELLQAKKIVYQLIRKCINGDFYSQATQDLFAIAMQSKKKNGFYLEVGGGHPSDSNDTFLLETEYQWSGCSLEYNEDLIELYNRHRKNKAIHADATCFDYEKKLTSMSAPKQIDYLSIDIDPANNTYKALLAIPHQTYRFSVITFEHDRYQSGDKYMDLARSFLKSLGYQLVVSNVNVFGKDFEDWWVDPTVISSDKWLPFKHENIEFAKLWI